jgi:hypothetical protein
MEARQRQQGAYFIKASIANQVRAKQQIESIRGMDAI